MSLTVLDPSLALTTIASGMKMSGETGGVFDTSTTEGGRKAFVSGIPVNQVMRDLWDMFTTTDQEVTWDALVDVKMGRSRGRQFLKAPAGDIDLKALERDSLVSLTHPYVLVERDVTEGKVTTGQRVVLSNGFLGVTLYSGVEVRELWLRIHEDASFKAVGYYIATAQSIDPSTTPRMTAQKAYDALKLPIFGCGFQAVMHIEEDDGAIGMALSVGSPTETPSPGIQTLFLTPETGLLAGSLLALWNDLQAKFPWQFFEGEQGTPYFFSTTLRCSS